MLVANTSSSPTHRPVEPAVERERSRFASVLLWVLGIVLAFVVPLAVVVGAILVSSYGIPLPFEVRIP